MAQPGERTVASAVPGAFKLRRIEAARIVRSLVVPLAIALPPLFWVADGTSRASRTPLGRDQGIFQYVAWALRHGAVDYRDVRDVNGPLTHLVHLVFLALGGADDHRFRVLDLALTGATFALVGACMPGLNLRRRRGPDALDRAAWAIAGWVTLSGQYLLYLYWDLAQRESFCDWFMLSSVALQLVAQAPWARRPRRLLAIAGALSVVPWFGKPTYVLFTAAQVFTLLPGGAMPVARRRALGWFAAGGALTGIAGVALLAVFADLPAFLRIQLIDVPAMYRFIWPHAAAEVFSRPFYANNTIFAIAGAIVVFALIALQEMPPRAMLVALVPLCGLGSVLVQAKGFPYHFHPVTAGIHLQWLAFAAWVAERARVASRRKAAVRLVPLAVATLLGVRVGTTMEDSPYVRAVWLLGDGFTPEERSTAAYFAHFPEPDYFPYEMRQTAAYLREHTQPDDTVQSYGMDPYVLFLAERASATPYIYGYDLDADVALAGGPGGVPTETQAATIRHIRDTHEDDLLARLEARPPAAFVFLDSAPLMTEPDAWDDFEEHCQRAAPWVRAHYREAARFGHDHVWLKRDNADATQDDLGPPESPEKAGAVDQP